MHHHITSSFHSNHWPQWHQHPWIPFLRNTTRGILLFLAPEHATKMVREAEITDPTGTINLSVWDSHIQQIEDNQFYTMTNCKLKQYFGKRLATTVNTTITKAQEQDISHVEPSHKQANWVCCPEILNIYPTVYPVCNNKDCRKKISENPGSMLRKIVLRD